MWIGFLAIPTWFPCTTILISNVFAGRDLRRIDFPKGLLRALGHLVWDLVSSRGVTAGRPILLAHLARRVGRFMPGSRSLSLEAGCPALGVSKGGD